MPRGIACPNVQAVEQTAHRNSGSRRRPGIYLRSLYSNGRTAIIYRGRRPWQLWGSIWTETAGSGVYQVGMPRRLIDLNPGSFAFGAVVAGLILWASTSFRLAGVTGDAMVVA
jgi:hypothetical protein